ncbi:MAG: hypothetical protein JO316_14925 [Abitibacteriaceae bacterium]|nr:hypothetical protein [Abditibacteriaceae bacterium]
MLFTRSALYKNIQLNRAKTQGSSLWQRALGAMLIATACTTPGCRAQTTTSPVTTQAAQPLPIPAGLDNYIARPEPVYKWEKMAKPTNQTGQANANDLVAGLAQGAQVTDIRLTSQEWQGQLWTHHVQIFRPAKLELPDTALVFVTYGGGSPGETLFGQLVANATGATFVQLFDIPNQPLYGKREDDLIAYTFSKYLETGDETWPLLFPMTKSVVKAMDAVGELSQQEWHQPIKRFIVSGASKRGWTSWLTAAVDKRVIGIIPMVYNNLDLQKQMPHQLATWGEYSAQIQDYTRRGLQQQMGTPRGRMLAAMVDPWTYRDHITVPKLVVNAANDPYWPLDAFNLYKNDLKGETNVLYAPNAGHSLGGQEQRVFGSAAEWCRRVANGQPIPQVALTAQEAQPDGSRAFSLSVTPAQETKAARLWVARSATRDFRPAKWQEMPLEKNTAGAYNITVPAKADAAMKYAAAFAEIEGTGKPLPLRLSSDVFIWDTP